MLVGTNLKPMNFPTCCSTATQSLSQTHLTSPTNPTTHILIRDTVHNNNDKTVSWTSSITRHCKNGMLSKATTEFCRMRLAGIQPNDVTFTTLLSACAHHSSISLPLGVLIHAHLLKLGFAPDNVILWTALVDMYSKCSLVQTARQVFDGMSAKNAMSWNTMIDGYMRSGDFKNAVILFDQMPVRGKISWTVLVTGFVKQAHFVEALECFREMQLSGVQPDHVTIIALMSACANLGLLALGMWFHRYAMQHGMYENIRVRNSLIDMYSRCGCVDFARQEFQNMTNRSLVSWNSMIVGLAINGHAEEALEHFSAMQNEGFKPREVSFIGALTACSHAGLVEKGLQLYDTMTKVHRISPKIEHYGCVVDLLSRAGRLEDAFSVIDSMPMKPNEVVLGSLLTACRTRGDVTLAEKLSPYLVGADSNYITLSNIYADMRRWDGVGKVRRTMKASGITKTPGSSAIEIDCSVHEFLAGDKSHVHSEHIYALLHQLSRECRLYGYVPEINADDLPV